MINGGGPDRAGAARWLSQKVCKAGVSSNRARTVSLVSPGCDRARADTPEGRCHRSLPRHHRPARCAPARRAGRPPRAAPPEHRHRRGDRAARRHRRPGRAASRCAVPAAAPGSACSRRRLRAAVLITAHRPEPGSQGTHGSLIHAGPCGAASTRPPLVGRPGAGRVVIAELGQLSGLPAAPTRIIAAGPDIPGSAARLSMSGQRRLPRCGQAVL